MGIGAPGIRRQHLGERRQCLVGLFQVQQGHPEVLPGIEAIRLDSKQLGEQISLLLPFTQLAADHRQIVQQIRILNSFIQQLLIEIPGLPVVAALHAPEGAIQPWISQCISRMVRLPWCCRVCRASIRSISGSWLGRTVRHRGAGALAAR
jgi:hypothetical protein